MNRSQTRKFRSLAKRKGVSHSLAEMYISMRNRGSAPQDLREGDLVRLNIEQIMKHPDYLRLSKRYRDFVETHAETSLLCSMIDLLRSKAELSCCLERRSRWLAFLDWRFTKG